MENVMGMVGYNQSRSNNGLPNVSDPKSVQADITYRQYMDYKKDFQQFELDQIEKSQTDTGLIDQAFEDAPKAAELSQQSQQRSLSRYGAELTPAQAQQMQRSNQRTGKLGMINAVQNARLAQQEQNTTLMSDLINIGQGLNRSSLQMIGSAAQNQSNREQAYDNAKAQSKASTMGTIGALGAAAIMFL